MIKLIKLALVLVNCIPFFPLWNIVSLLLLWATAFAAGYYSEEMDNIDMFTLVFPYMLVVMELFVYSLLLFACPVAWNERNKFTIRIGMKFLNIFTVPEIRSYWGHYR